MAEDKITPIKFNATEPPQAEIGIEQKDSIVNMLADDEGAVSNFDYNKINNFRQISDKRENIYSIFDDMSKDVIISSALDMYAEDSTEYADDGRVIWAESSESEIATCVNDIMLNLKLDENAWQYLYHLVKYGDLYLETFRETDMENINLKNGKSLKSLKEGVIVKMYGKNDRLKEYVELVPNPAEVFDLTKRGKTVGFVKTNVTPKTSSLDAQTSIYQYDYRTDDIFLYDPTKYVHIYLPDTTSRNPEKIKLFTSDKKNKLDTFFNVKRGKSILYDLFKIYREVKLLQDSILLNRLTKSSLVRILQIEVGEMGRTQAHQLLQRTKSLFEQKMSINEGVGLADYNNPGAIERNIYLQTRNGKGAITPQTLGGDFQAGQLTDLQYFNNMLFAGLKIPKPFLGFLDDNAGFSAGQSLMRISTRYSKTIKRFKNAFMQGIRTLINIFLIDRGLDEYVNNFTIKMQSPSTQEDSERAETLETRLRIVEQVVGLFQDIDSNDKLKLTKLLLSEVISNSEVITLVSEMIEKVEESSNSEPVTNAEEDSFELPSSGSLSDQLNDENNDLNNDLNTDENNDILPNPADLEIDFSDNDI